ncbi:MAG: hypothetical protein ACREM8_03760 [Vulcanimicrobiaceae bacterium]
MTDFISNLFFGTLAGAAGAQVRRTRGCTELATALGQTDPLKWPLAAWLSDIGPRCVYGWVTCITHDGLTAGR